MLMTTRRRLSRYHLTCDHLTCVDYQNQAPDHQGRAEPQRAEAVWQERAPTPGEAWVVAGTTCGDCQSASQLRRERGEQNVSIDNIEKLAHALGVRPEKLFAGIP